MAVATGSFFVGCDTAVVLSQLTDDQGNVIANATVVGSLFLKTTAVANSAITFTPVMGSPGDYQATIPSTIPFQESKEYSLVITATLSNGKVVEFRIKRTAKVLDI